MMKIIFKLTLISLIMLLLGSQSIRFVQGAATLENTLTSTSIASTAPWTIETVDSTNDTGQHVSVAIDQDNGAVYVSYYDNTTKDLRGAKYVGSGGNCGVDNSWDCQTLDQGGDVGEYSSIAVKPQTVNVGIAYYDDSQGELQYATGCFAPYCLWAYVTIDSGNPSGFLWDGLYTSLVYHSDGTPAIAYYTFRGLSDDSLKVAYYSGSGGNCGQGGAAGKWQCDTLASGDGVGRYPSLALDSAGNRHIAYYDGGNDSLMYAFSSGGSYTIREILPTQSGLYASLVVDANHGNARHIAHYDDTNNTLEYATFVGSGGNCGFNSSSTQFEWQCDEIEDMGTDPSSPRGLAIAVDDAGYPIIAYGASYNLKIARPAAALGLLVGNCGPIPSLFYTWQCDTIALSRLGVGQANYASIAVNSAGLATIAYYGDFSASSDDNGNLKVAYQRLNLFLPLISKQ
jgi:hypothetical protein